MTWLFLVLFFSAGRPFLYEFELPTWDACEAERAEMAGWYEPELATVSHHCWARLPGI